MNLKIASCVVPAFCLLASSVMAAEQPIGEPQECGGMEIAAVYLQPIEMDPAHYMRLASESDIHLEVDLSATEGNVTGFQEGSWIPYLDISYELTKKGSSKVIKGHAHTMVANDGPHYGDNIKLDGAGSYHLKVITNPPKADSNFGRHVDKETGVGAWFKQCITEYDFVYIVYQIAL